LKKEVAERNERKTMGGRMVEKVEGIKKGVLP
jgi:hypothetical protein